MKFLASRCDANSFSVTTWSLLGLIVLSLSSAAAAQSASVSPTALNFLTQVLSTTSAAKAVTLTNTGTVSLSITSITTSGDFAQTNNCGSSLTGGAKCTINVTFTPTVIGSRTGALSINDNASGSPQTVSLSGSGTIVSLSPTALGFGSVAVGGSVVQTVTLTNASSTATLKITGVSFSGTNASDFSQTNTCGSSVSPGASCSITVTFKPAATGTRRASLNVSDNGGASPQSVSLSGTGTTATLVSIAVTPANPSVAAGQTQQFTATGTYSDGSTQNLTTTATWSSSNTAVATISNAAGTQGLATSLTQGTSTITATSGTISGSATLTVTAGSPVLVSIAVTPTSPGVSVGATLQLTATGNYSDGSTQNLTNSVTWSSTDTAVATVQTTGQTNPGLVTGVAAGTATINASFSSITGSTSVTVQQSSTNAIITTIAGGGPTGVSAISADSNLPYAVAVDINHNFYVAVPTQNRIYEVNSSGTLTLIAGTGLPGYAGDLAQPPKPVCFIQPGLR